MAITYSIPPMDVPQCQPTRAIKTYMQYSNGLQVATQILPSVGQIYPPVAP